MVLAMSKLMAEGKINNVSKSNGKNRKYARNKKRSK